MIFSTDQQYERIKGTGESGPLGYAAGFGHQSAVVYIARAEDVSGPTKASKQVFNNNETENLNNTSKASTDSNSLTNFLANLSSNDNSAGILSIDSNLLVNGGKSYTFGDAYFQINPFNADIESENTSIPTTEITRGGAAQQLFTTSQNAEGYLEGLTHQEIVDPQIADIALPEVVAGNSVVTGTVGTNVDAISKQSTFTSPPVSTAIQPAPSALTPTSPINDAPTASNLSVSMAEDASYTFSVSDFSFQDINNDSFATVAFKNLSPEGLLALGNNKVIENQVISTADINTGLLTFTPSPDFNQSIINFASFQVGDDAGIFDKFSQPYSLNINVTPVNDAPIAGEDSLTTVEDVALTMNAATLLGNDSDIDGDTLAIQSFTQPLNGSLVDNGDGTFTYTANANYNGADSFTYTVIDANGATDSATVSLNVTAVNDAPVASNDSLTTAEDVALTMNAATLLGNDSDIDGDTLAIQSFTQPLNEI